MKYRTIQTKPYGHYDMVNRQINWQIFDPISFNSESISESVCPVKWALTWTAWISFSALPIIIIGFPGLKLPTSSVSSFPLTPKSFCRSGRTWVFSNICCLSWPMVTSSERDKEMIWPDHLILISTLILNSIKSSPKVEWTIVRAARPVSAVTVKTHLLTYNQVTVRSDSWRNLIVITPVLRSLDSFR